MKRPSLITTLGAALLLGLSASPLQAADFKIDPTHSFVEFSTSHLGISMLKGRFNTLSGQFSYDAASPAAAKIQVTVETTSIDTNHAERDKHLKSKDFLDVEAHPKATLVSTGYSENGKTGLLKADLTLNGVTRPVEIPVELVGAGNDPWGGYRQGFQGTLTIKQSEFGYKHKLVSSADTLKLELSIEGIRQ